MCIVGKVVLLLVRYRTVMNELSQKIISKLPYGDGFRFVDEITFVDDNRIVGNYTFKADAPYYKWHFKHRPVTPGVLLIECMGQIGMASHIIFLEKLYDSNAEVTPVMQNMEISFLTEVLPGDKLEVEAHKIYYRNGVLKSSICLRNSEGEECLIGSGQVKLLKNG